MKREVYMDYAATTYTKPEVYEEMKPYITEYFGNPSSIYHISRNTKMAIDTARNRVASAINARLDEIYFTAGGSESDNWALKGVALANRHKGNHIITTSIEHHAVIHCCEYLEKLGFEVTYLKVNEEGLINIEELKNSIKDTTILISVMFANNEIGTIQPIAEIGQICKDKNIIFHTDAVQAVGNIHIDVKRMNIDLLSMASHKFYGPKGVGALYIRKGIKIDNLIHGGGQERAKRAGTENIPSIVGMGKAIELAYEKLDSEKERLTSLRNMLKEGLLKIEGSKLNGALDDRRLPGNVNVSFKDIEGETFLMMLDSMGICASSGSACSAGALEASHVLLAIGLDTAMAKSAIRLTIGSGTTEEEVQYVIQCVTDSVNKTRANKRKWNI